MADLQRFLDAQAAVYPQVLRELRAGSKRTHWMWFIFPQLAGLGHSPTAAFYGITSLGHARSYLAHPLLGSRLRECVRLLNGHSVVSAERIFGYPDHLKLRSCLTLFLVAAPEEPLFPAALEKYYDAATDPATLILLQGSST